MPNEKKLPDGETLRTGEDCVKFLNKRIAFIEDMFRDSIMRGELKAFSGEAMTVMYNYNDDTFLKLAKKTDRIEDVADAVNNSTVLDELRPVKAVCSATLRWRSLNSAGEAMTVKHSFNDNAFFELAWRAYALLIEVANVVAEEREAWMDTILDKADNNKKPFILESLADTLTPGLVQHALEDAVYVEELAEQLASEIYERIIAKGPPV